MIDGKKIDMPSSKFVIWDITPKSNNQCILDFTPMNEHYTYPQTKPANIIKLQIKSL